jgi:hypothetical protein
MKVFCFFFSKKKSLLFKKGGSQVSTAKAKIIYSF